MYVSQPWHIELSCSKDLEEEGKEGRREGEETDQAGKKLINNKKEIKKEKDSGN